MAWHVKAERALQALILVEPHDTETKAFLHACLAMVALIHPMYILDRGQLVFSHVDALRSKLGLPLLDAQLHRLAAVLNHCSNFMQCRCSSTPPGASPDIPEVKLLCDAFDLASLEKPGLLDFLNSFHSICKIAEDAAAQAQGNMLCSPAGQRIARLAMETYKLAREHVPGTSTS